MRFRNSFDRGFQDHENGCGHGFGKGFKGFFADMAFRHNKGFRRGFGPGFGFSGFMENLKGKFLSSEEMHLIILKMISEGKSHGYEIIKAVDEMTNGIYSPSPGMIYPLLSYITEIGHAVSEQDGNRKTFAITEDGKAFLEKNQDAVSKIYERINIIAQRFSEMRNHLDEEDFTEDRWGHSQSGAPDYDTRREFGKLRRELRNALVSKRAASQEEKQRVLDILRRAIQEINETEK